jgi:hypothetical protein
MAQINYPLKQVLEVKKKRVEDAEKNVLEKRKALEAEKEKLKQREIARDQVKQHHNDKLQQMRDELDKVTNTGKVQQMKAYIKVVKENLKVEEKKVKEQQAQVETAENNLKLALAELAQKRIEVDKLEIHKKDFIQSAKKEIEINEEKEFNEQGAIIYTMRKRREG